MPDSQTPEPLISKALIIGNWKMNGSRSSVAKLTEDIQSGLGSVNVQVVICPPAVFIADVANVLHNDTASDSLEVIERAAQAVQQTVQVQIGAQNICEYESGAYTGEISGGMLGEFSCRYVIIGHSERRQNYHESDGQIANKFIAARKAGLQPVVCVGETAAEYKRGETRQVVQGQLDAIIDRVGVEALASAVIAYEPIWAIGTGEVATAEVAQQVLLEVRSQLGVFGAQTQLIYGGSVTPENAEQLFKQRDINGALVGGASLDADQFVGICKIADLN
jgi:triosephosphate isomerase